MTQESIFKILETNEERRKYLEQLFKDFKKFTKIYDLIVLLHLVGYFKKENRKILDDGAFKFNQKLKEAVISFLEKYKFIEFNGTKISLKDKKIDIQKITWSRCYIIGKHKQTTFKI